VVADGHAICILLERSTAAPGLVTRPVEGLFGEGIGDRDCLGNDHSGMRKIAQLASRYYPD